MQQTATAADDMRKTYKADFKDEIVLVDELEKQPKILLISTFHLQDLVVASILR